MDGLIELTVDVSMFLRRSECFVLTEDDLNRYLHKFHLTRESGNFLAGFLVDNIDIRGCLVGVEMFINQETTNAVSISLLVARTDDAYMRKHKAMHNEFNDKYQNLGKSEMNLYSHS